MKKYILLSLSIIWHQLSYAQNFEKIAVAALDNKNYHSSSTSWGDFDNDGDLDLFITNGESNEPNEFYINEGRGRFRTVLNNLTAKGVSSFGSAWGDYDNDGWLDLYVANCNYQEETGELNFLFKNNGDGSFTKMVDHTLVKISSTSYACSWMDYNNDGWLDLYVANAYERKNQLYQNNGDGTFQEITNGPVVEEMEHNIGCNWSDFDNDGDVDLLLISADWGVEAELYRNNGDGSFTKLIDAIRSNRQVQWRGANWGDYNNDGWMDVLLVNNQGGENVLFINNEGQSFTEVLPPAFNTSSIFSGNSSHWGDFDNDGDFDLVSNFGINENNEFHDNNGMGGFTLLNNDWTAAKEGAIWSISCPDVNFDGYLDILNTNRFNRDGSGEGFRNELFLNRSSDCNDFLLISLRGVESNFYGIGAKVIIYGTNSFGQKSLQKRELSCLSGGGYTTQSGNTLHFGLKDWEPIDSLVVEWPSGIRTKYQGLTLNEHHQLFENGEGTIVSPAFAIKPVFDPRCPNLVTSLVTTGASNQVSWYTNGALISNADSINLVRSDGTWYFAQDGVCGGRDSFFVPNNQLILKVFPNPTATVADFKITGSIASKADVELFDIRGRLIRKFEIDLVEGFARNAIPVSDLPSGVYLLVVEVGCLVETEKLVVISK